MASSLTKFFLKYPEPRPEVLLNAKGLASGWEMQENKQAQDAHLRLALTCARVRGAFPRSSPWGHGRQGGTVNSWMPCWVGFW